MMGTVGERRKAIDGQRLASCKGAYFFLEAVLTAVVAGEAAPLAVAAVGAAPLAGAGAAVVVGLVFLDIRDASKERWATRSRIRRFDSAKNAGNAVSTAPIYSFASNIKRSRKSSAKPMRDFYWRIY